MKKPLIYYGELDGEIDRIVISPLRDDIQVYSRDGEIYRYEDVTNEGDIYDGDDWVACFSKDSDLNLIHFIELIIELLEIDEVWVL
jgi:hypothetical protein